MEFDDFDDSTEHLYSVLTGNEDIDNETVDTIIKQQVGEAVQQMFNNQEQLKQQLADEDES